MNKFFLLNLLHIFNDGYEASFLLLLPFISKDLHINLAQVGILGSTANVMELLFAIPAVYIAKKLGGFPSLMLAILFYSVGFVATSFVSFFPLFFLTFAISGIGFGLFHPISFALISRWSEGKHRGRTMGNFTAIGDLGRIGISSLVTFVIVYLGWRHTAFIYALVSGILLTILSRIIFSSKTSVDIKQEKTRNVSVIKFLQTKAFIFANMVNLLDTIASSSLFVFLPFLLIKRGVNPSVLGVFAAAYFVGNFLGKTILGRIVDKFGNAGVFILSEILMAIFIFILANSTRFPIIIISSIILGVFTKGTVPVVKTMVSESISHHNDFEKAFGINSVVAGLAVTITPIMLGYISYQYGIIQAFNFEAVFALCATVPAFFYEITRRK